VGDLLHFSRPVPGIPVVRRMRLGAVAGLRDRADGRPSWVAVFAKAFALTARAVPEFRRAVVGAVRPRLYESDDSVASVAVEREFDGGPAVFFARIERPDAQPLAVLDAALRHFRTADVESVPDFRRLIRVSRLWRPLRRAAWWYGLKVDARRRARRFGTFGLSSYSALGADSTHPVGPLTVVMNYGVIGADGEVDVRLVYDHRVMDGATVARGLALMERVLTTDIADELGRLAHCPARAAA
jgi:hypothetical protein